MTSDEELWNKLEWAEPAIAPESWKECAGLTVHHCHLWCLVRGEKLPLGGIIMCKPGEQIAEDQKRVLLVALKNAINKEQAIVLRKGEKHDI